MAISAVVTVGDAADRIIDGVKTRIEKLNVGPGDTIVSTPEQVFDLAGVYPLKMRITGILPQTGGPDDRAVFVDLKTAWIIEGIAHGHEEAGATQGTVLEADGDNSAGGIHRDHR